ncbi:hypothetical protein T439DRAFT_320715 [Meredithblackwellia eburnea MCA 4105]
MLMTLRGLKELAKQVVIVSCKDLPQGAEEALSIKVLVELEWQQYETQGATRAPRLAEDILDDRTFRFYVDILLKDRGKMDQKDDFIVFLRRKRGRGRFMPAEPVLVVAHSFRTSDTPPAYDGQQVQGNLHPHTPPPPRYDEQGYLPSSSPLPPYTENTLASTYEPRGRNHRARVLLSQQFLTAE